MKNISYLTKKFYENGFFKKINKEEIKDLESYDTIYAFRLDGIGQRIFAYLNCFRVAKKLNKKFFILWDTSSTRPTVVLHGHDFDAHLIYEDLPIKYFNS